jgi:hypothetical protein
VIVTVARGMMGRWKKEGNHFPPNKEMKKIDAQLQITTK